MADLFEWTNLFPASTGAPVTIWVNVKGIVATDPHRPEIVQRHEAVSAWVELNRETLETYWRGDIDGAEVTARLVNV